jgi:cation-transporting P-type ATPase 13A2
VDSSAKLSNGCGTNYGLMTKSSSLDTVTDTNTQMMTISNSRTAEFSINIEEPEDVEDDADMRLDRELPNNNYRFALVGKTWAVLKDYFPELLPKICTRGTIFARMSPDQKQALISELQDLGYYVAMCGDGANDCGALKAAHTGISLSEAESSVASPFTSRNPTIACVPNIIKEGRTALVTSFGIFKYMAAYSLVQFTSVLILYSIDSNLTDFQFLYIDLFLISVFALFFGRTSSYDGPLVKQTPLNSLISLSPICSLIVQVALAILFQVIGWYHVQSMEWFEPFNFTEVEGEPEHLGCHQNYTIFAISAFQYVILAIVFSKGAPYRKSIVSNLPLLFSIIGNVIFATYLVVYPAQWLADQFGLIVPDDIQFRALLLAYGLVNFVLAFIIEAVLIEYLLFKKMRYRFHKIDKSRRKFLAVENHLRTDSKWPPLCLHPADIVSSDTATEQGDKQSPLSFAEILVEEQLDSASTLDHGASILNIFFEQPQTGGGEGEEEQVFHQPKDNSVQAVTCVVKDQEITLNPKALTIYANEQNSSLTNTNNNNNNAEKAMPAAANSELEPLSSADAPRS